MKQPIKKTVTSILIATMLLGIMSAPMALAVDEPTLAMSVANKIDVALAVGPTSVDYATFEADLRQALKYEDDGVTPRAHPVPDEDVYIMSTKAVSANTTSEFSWWTYDHTRPFYSGEYDGVAVLDDESHLYSELSTRASSAATNAYMDAAPNVWGPPGATATNAPGLGYAYIAMGETNPDPTNPDFADYYGTTNARRIRHPYQGNNTHMMQTNGGATMDFYGYPQDSFRDWQYLPNDQKTVKTFEFSIAEDLAFDALDGVGFFFNTEINGSYAAGTQTMSGYLLFLQYDDKTGKGDNITIYKFKDVNTKDFHHATGTGVTTSSAQYTIAGYNGTKTATSTTYKPQFIPVAKSTVYTGLDFSRRIRVEASPTQVKVYYKGSTTPNNPAVLDPTNPGYEDLTDLNLVNFTTGSLAVTGLGTVPLQTGSTILMDKTYIGPNTDNGADYGFGPMAAYLAHGCARPTHIALQNLSMTVEKVKTLTEVVREPEWHENTIKYLVNLNENTIADFEENAIIAELLARLTNDNIYYIGWGSTENAIASVGFLRKHSLKGTIVDIEAVAALATDPKTAADWAVLGTEIQEEYLKQIVEALTHKEQIQAIADEIYKRYWNQADDGRALNTDTVILSVSGADMQNTADAAWPTGKWMITHTIDEDTIEIDDGIYMTNFEGEYPLSGVYVPDLESPYVFQYPGLYEIFYRDVQIGALSIHRKPVAEFYVTLDEDVPIFTNTSYDPDVSKTALSEEGRGIVSSVYSWINLDDELMTTPVPGTPPSLNMGDGYIVTLTVTDMWGAESSTSRLVTYAEAESAEALPPFADFKLGPTSTFIKTLDTEEQQKQKIVLKNESYDPGGETITSTWTVFLNDVPYPAFAITDAETEYVIGDLPAGSYKISLMVTNDSGIDSEIVAKMFEIVEDLFKPTAAISVAAPKTFVGNTGLSITFSDTGGSGYKENRYAIVAVGALDPAPTLPGTSDPAWSLTSKGVVRSITVNAVGENYVFWEAWDNAGNYNSGVFGPYTMNKKDLSLSFTATPVNGTVIYDDPLKPITLTATLTVGPLDDMPTGTVFFYQDGTLLGNAPVNTSGVAIWEGNPLWAGTGSVFTAEYGGDSNYAKKTEDDTCDVGKNDSATVVIGTQTNRTYNAEPFDVTNVTVTGTTYIIEYEGTGSTTYARSETPPTDAGTYVAIVTTNNASYVMKTDSAEFEIYQRELGLALSVSPEDAEYGDTATLTATLTNAKGLPEGYVEFYVDGMLVDTAYDTSFTLEDYDAVADLYTHSAQTAAWASIGVGEYDLLAVFVPAAPYNYYAEDDEISEYSVSKASQTISFIEGTTINKTYGDADFTVTANGGSTLEDIEYTVINGNALISIDVSGGVATVTILGAGQAIIRATQPGDANYNKGQADIIINIAKKDNLFTISMPSASVEYGEDLAITVDDNESLGIVTYEYEGTGATAYGPADEPPTGIGTYKVTATSAETANYNDASDTLTFSIVPCTCACSFTLSFEGTTITIPYYAFQGETGLAGSYEFTSCGNPRHTEIFDINYEVSTATAPGMAAIVGGKLAINDAAVGETIIIRYTATHLPTGYVEWKEATFVVAKAPAPTGMPDESTPEENEESGLETLNKNDDSNLEVDVSTTGTSHLKATYKNGPGENATMYGQDLGAGGMCDVIDENTVSFTSEFISSLYAGLHEIELDVDGNKMTFYLYVPAGQIDLQVNSGLAMIPSGGVKDTKGLADAEAQDETSKKAMSKGYDVLIRVNILDAGNSDEMNLIDGSKGKMAIGAFLNIELEKIYRESQTAYATEMLKEIDDPIQFTIDIPAGLLGHDKYIVARAHTPVGGGNPMFDLLDTEQDGDKLTFISNKFSTFAILYEDVNNDIYIGNPKGNTNNTNNVTNNDDADDANDAAGNEDSEDEIGIYKREAPDNEGPYVSGRVRQTLETEEHIKYINGYEDGTVRPNNAITRAEVAAIFYRLLKNPTAAGDNIFSDVPDGAWYALPVNSLASIGVIDGYEDGTFKPAQNITRAEFAAIASRFDDLEEHGGNPFTDLTDNNWAYESILSAYAKGWVDGYPGGEVRPNGNITRAEVITVVNSMLGRMLDPLDVPEDLLALYPDLPTTHWAFADVIEASVAHDYSRQGGGYEFWESYHK